MALRYTVASAGTDTTLATRNMTLYPTILSGDIGMAADSTDNVYHVVTFVPTAASPIDTTATTLDGFTVTLGDALGANTNFTVNGQSINRQFGGGIYMGAASSGLVCSPKIANCIITRNAAINGGGSYLNAASGGNASPVFRSSGFFANNAAPEGGGIYIISSATGGQTNPVFDDCTLTSNIVTANGAGMFASVTSPATGLVMIKGCTFSTNKQTAAASSSGSALFFTNNVSAIVSKCSFNNNTAATFGGGIEAYGMQNLTIDSSSFTGNTCSSTGGALDLTGAAVAVTNSTFTGNKSGYGGGIEFEASINFGVNSLSVANSTFINDTATVSGGAMRNAVSNGVTVTNTKFLNNYGATGSAALDNAGNSLANMRGCVFSGNKAGTLGGVLNNANGTAAFTNCVLESNSTTAATANGGAVHVAAGTVTFNNSTLSNNSTASTTQPNSNSIGIDAGATAVLNNTIVWGSAANHVAGSGTLTRNYSDVKGVAATVNNLNTDPQFTNATDPDGADNIWATADDGLSLSQCSPVINLGSNALIPGGITTDITGAVRIQQTIVDMGAYEFSSSNVLAITATSTNPTTCGGTNGSISLSGLTAATAYTVNYSMNGAPQSPLTLTANGSGVITISGLGSGSYTNFSVMRGSCASNIIAGPVTLSPPAAPVITSVTSTNPLTCGGTTGTMTLNGLAASTIYTITYFDGVSTVTLNNQTSTAAGMITITGLGTGSYSAITAILAGCSGIYGSTVTLSSPATPAAPTASNNGPICTGSTLNLSASTLAGGTYTWSGPGSYSSAAQNPSITNAQVVNSGTYSVTVTVAGCVSLPGTTTVTVNLIPVITTVAGTNPLTCGSATGTMTLSGLAPSTIYTVTYFNGTSTVTLNNQTSTAAGTITITGLPAGTYSAITAIVAGCSGIYGSTVTLSSPVVPAAPTASNNGPICAGSTLNLSASTLAGGTYTWSGPGSYSSATQNPSITNAQIVNSGTYSVTVTVAGCVSAPGTTIVTVNPTPAITATSTNPTTCGGANGTISLNGLTTGITYMANYSFNGNPQSPLMLTANGSGVILISGLSAGSYTNISVTSLSCTSNVIAGPVVLSPPAAPVITSVTSTNPLTCGGTTGTMTLNGLAASTIYTITYFNGTSTVTLNNQTSTAAGTITITSLGTGSYSSITAILASCSGVYGSTVTLSSPATPAAPTASNNGPICAGSTLNLGVLTVAGGTYTWSGPGSYSSATQNPSITNAQVVNSGTYSVTVTIAGCVSAPGTTNVTVNPVPAITAVAGTSPATCSGTNGSITLSGLTASGTYVINFSRNATAQAPQILTANGSGVVTIPGLNAGTYTLFTATLGSCTAPATGSVILSDPAPPAAPAISSNTPVCAGSTLSLTGPATAGVTYSWSGPNSFISTLQSPAITGAITAATGTYSLTITSTTTLCASLPATLTATVYPIPAITTVISTNPLTCSGATGTITLNGLMASSSYTVNYLKNSVAQTAMITATVAGSIIITGLTAGTYTSIYVTQNGCSSGSVASVILSDPAVPAAPVAGSNSPVCQGAQLNLTATGGAGATFSWTGPASFTSAAANPSIPNMQTVNAGTYSVTQTLAGCVSTAATIVVAMSTVPTAPGIIAGNAAPCAASSYTYSISPVTTATSYTWSLPSGWTITSSPANTTSITVTTGTASGTISVTASNVCGPGSASTLAAGILTIPATPGAISGPPALCNGVTTSYFVSAVSGVATYTWNYPAGWSGYNFVNNLTATAGPASGTVSVTADNVCGSSAPSSLYVTVTSMPLQPGIITGNNNPCINSSQGYSVAAVGGATAYAWTYPAGGSPAWTGGSTTTSITLGVGAAGGNITVAASNGCGTGPSRALAVSVIPLPAQPSAISGPLSPCVGATVAYSTSSTGATSYSWQLPAGWPGTSASSSVNATTTSAGGNIIVTPYGVCGAGPSQSLAVTVTPVVTPSVAISTGSLNICASATDTFTAVPTGGGPTPTYQWKKNGVAIAGATGATYVAGGFTSGDVITVTLVSSLPCVNATQVTSIPDTIVVFPVVTPGINVNTVPPTILCAGTSLTFITNIVAGGAAPQYTWYKNGNIIAGATGPTYTSAALLNGDTLRAVLRSSAFCRSTDTAYSNKVGLRVNPVVTPSVSVAASPSGPVATGTAVTFTATQSGGGTTPDFQWRKNGVNIPFATGPTYTSSTLVTGDRISVAMLSYDPCATPARVVSNEIRMEVGTTGVAGAPGGGWTGSILLYPNPSGGHFTVAAGWDGSHVGSRVSVDILNALGQLVYHTELTPTTSKWSHDVWLGESLANGQYLLRIGTTDMHATLLFTLLR